MLLLTLTFKVSSVSSSRITRQVNDFAATDAPPVFANSSCTSDCCGLFDFLLNARGTNFDRADSIAVNLLQELHLEHPTPAPWLQRRQKLTASDHYEVIHFNVTSVVVVDKHSTLFTSFLSSYRPVYNTRTTFSHQWFLERRHTRQPTLLRLCSSYLPTKPCDTASQQLRACEATSASNVYAWARTCQWWGAIAKNADEHNHEDT